MKRETQQVGRRRRGYLPSFFVTMLWLIPTMLVTGVVGFFLARDVFSPKFLQPSKVQNDKPRPIRILSPDEVSRLSKDKDSAVWTEGVKSSDIPEMESQALYRDDETHSRHTKRKATKKRVVNINPQDEPTAEDQPTDTAATSPSEDNADTGTETTTPPQDTGQPSFVTD